MLAAGAFKETNYMHKYLYNTALLPHFGALYTLRNTYSNAQLSFLVLAARKPWPREFSTHRV